MCLRDRMNFVSFSLSRAGTKPNFENGLQLRGKNIWKNILDRNSASATGPGAPRMRAAGNPGPMPGLDFSAPTTLHAGHSRWRSARGRLGCSSPSLLPARRTGSSAARVSWAVAGDGSSCGKSAPNLTGDPVQRTKWPFREQPLCFQRREDRDAFAGNSFS